MITVSINENKTIYRWANPIFNNADSRIEFQLSEKLFVKIGDSWEEITEAFKPAYKTIHLTNNNKINSETELLSEDGDAGFYNWILSLSAEKIGVSSGTDVIFVKIAEKIESFLTNNDLW